MNQQTLLEQFHEEQRLEREEELREQRELEDQYYSDLEYDDYCPCGCEHSNYLDDYSPNEFEEPDFPDEEMSCFDPSDYNWQV